MLAVTWKLGISFHWVGKDTLFAGWKGPFMRWFGGISIDRNHPESAMASILSTLNHNPNSCLVIAPDGTRGPHEYWKSGFYRIAQNSGLPVTLAFVDRTTKTSGIGPTFHVSGDLKADMDRIRVFYQDKAGFRPERRIEPRLRNESSGKSEA